MLGSEVDAVRKTRRTEPKLSPQGAGLAQRREKFNGSNSTPDLTLPMDLVGFGYAALVTFVSILGYKQRGGVPSLIAGLFVGFSAGYGALLCLQ